ncbi:MAG: hypothetical protein NVSMB52_02320 [Chloroflexota bacterium]
MARMALLWQAADVPGYFGRRRDHTNGYQRQRRRGRKVDDGRPEDVRARVHLAGGQNGGS